MSRTARHDPGVRAALEQLRTRGLLLQADAELASVASLIAGEPVTGSWWSHPRAHDIYAVLEALDEEPDALQLKLVRGKQTLVHRELWAAVLAVCTCGEPWQTRGLSEAARQLLRRVRQRGSLRLDQLRSWPCELKPGAAARELELRLLVHASEEHTERGRHSKRLETWAHWRDRVGFDEELPPSTVAKQVLERRLAPARVGQFPWPAES